MTEGDSTETLPKIHSVLLRALHLLFKGGAAAAADNASRFCHRFPVRRVNQHEADLNKCLSRRNIMTSGGVSIGDDIAIIGAHLGGCNITKLPYLRCRSSTLRAVGWKYDRLMLYGSYLGKHTKFRGTEHNGYQPFKLKKIFRLMINGLYTSGV